MKKRIVVIINGVARTGKDTFISMFSDIAFDHKTLHTRNISTIDSVKEKSILFGWDKISKTEADRLFWSRVKEAWYQYNKGPLTEVVSLTLEDNISSFFFINCREPLQIGELRDLFLFEGVTVKTLLITRDMPIPDNPSDRSVFDFTYDKTIENITLQKLEESAYQYFEELCTTLDTLGQ